MTGGRPIRQAGGHQNGGAPGEKQLASQAHPVRRGSARVLGPVPAGLKTLHMSFAEVQDHERHQAASGFNVLLEQAQKVDKAQ